MSLQTARDVPLLVNSENASSERRFSPSLTITQLRRKLEPITGIPPGQQQLVIQKSENRIIAVTSSDEDATTLGSFSIEPYDTLQVGDLRPASERMNFNDTSNVEKYEMEKEEYEKLGDSVLSWKKKNHLGRFDPHRSEKEKAEGVVADTVAEKGIEKGRRCKIGDSDRLGEVMYVGPVEEIPGGGVWIGVKLDEPMGKNDGSAGGKRYFQATEKHGSFVRPDRVEVGDFPPRNDLEDGVYEEL